MSGSSYTLFEAGQVRPLALSPSGKLLFAVNTPDGRLEVFAVDDSGSLRQIASVPVGLEPVAVAARSDDEVWVVNHLSDSVSIVKLGDGAKSGGVVRTLLVGDEPRDIVFAGPGRARAFITTAHRGQNSPVDPQLTTPGVGRADVWVFDAGRLGDSLGGDPLAIVNLFTDTPRALAVSPDGSRVYAAGFQSGNRTTVIHQTAFSPEEQALLPGPRTNAEGFPAPPTSLIVRFDGAHWVDEAGRAWDDKVPFTLPDRDVFVIDANAAQPAVVPGGAFSGVGTILYNMAVNPVSGAVYVSNTESHNEQSFEGPGTFAGRTVRGRFAENRVTVIGAGGVTPRSLDKHIDYTTCCAPLPNDESVRSLALPTGMAVSADGKTLYVAAMGSSKVGIFGTAALENDTFSPDVNDQIVVSGGGPTGLVLDERHNRLYVLTRFDDSISVLDTRQRVEVAHIGMHNPEPDSVTRGRRFLYDASTTSSHGNVSCASCHAFGDFDSLAWNLGNPDAQRLNNPGPFLTPLFNPLDGSTVDPTFHPMKGPMTTQSLRGMANHGPMHWRGDRTGGNDAPTAQPDSGSFDERAAFGKFAGAFADLLGRDSALPADQMSAFTDFILQLTYPPNPVRSLDNSLTTEQAKGRELMFSDRKFDGGAFTCLQCHALDAKANPGTSAPGFFGTTGGSTFDLEPQVFKVPHLRNMYQKVGMFGMPVNGFAPFDPTPNTGEQVRGFGFFHDGTVDTLFRFHGSIGFSGAISDQGFTLDAQGATERREVESFLFAFDSNMAPVVGQQVTLTTANADVAGPRIALLERRAETGECDLVAKTWRDRQELGFLYLGGGQFLTEPDGAVIGETPLRQLGTASGRALTFTCLPPGEGPRVAAPRNN